MTSVCSPSPLPTFSEIKIAFANIDFSASLPSMPTIPTPLFPSINSPDMSASTVTTEMMTNQFLVWIKSVLDPLMAFVGAIPLPTIPELGDASLDDILNAPSAQVNVWVNGIKAQLSAIQPPTLPDFSGLGQQSYDMEAVSKFQALIREYCAALVLKVKELMQSVKNLLSAPPFNFGVTVPTIPDIPTTFDGLMAPVFNVAGVPSFPELVAQYQLPTVTLPPIPELFVPFPGFESVSVAFPSPWYSSITSPVLEVIEASKAYFMSILMAAGKKIADFMSAISAFVSWSPPTFCVDATEAIDP